MFDSNKILLIDFDFNHRSEFKNNFENNLKSISDELFQNTNIITSKLELSNLINTSYRLCFCHQREYNNIIFDDHTYRAIWNDKIKYKFLFSGDKSIGGVKEGVNPLEFEIPRNKVKDEIKRIIRIICNNHHEINIPNDIILDSEKDLIDLYSYELEQIHKIEGIKGVINSPYLESFVKIDNSDNYTTIIEKINDFKEHGVSELQEQNIMKYVRK